MSPFEIAWVLGVMLFAAFVQSVGGFGFALMAVPLAALAIDLQTAVITVSLGSLFNVCILFWRTRLDVDRGLAKRFTVPALFGMPIGVAVLTLVDQRPLKVAQALLPADVGGWCHSAPNPNQARLRAIAASSFDPSS